MDDEKQAMIKYADSDTDSDASLAISGGSVGTEKTPLVVDVPENVTVLLPNVGDTFLETPVVTIVREDSGKIVPVWIDESDLLYENYAAVAEELGLDYVGVDPTTGEAMEEGKTLRHITDMLTTVDVGTIELTEDEIEGLSEDEIKALTEKKVEEKVAELLDELCAQAILDNGIPGAAATVDNSSRNVSIKVGTSTGETSVNNKGVISITVEGDSDLTVDKIISEGGDVTIDVQNGSLLAAEDGDSRIDATNVELSATENIGSEEQSVQVNERSVDTVVGARVLDQTGDGTGTTGRIDSYATTDEDGNEITGYTVDVAIGYDWVMDVQLGSTGSITSESEIIGKALDVNALDGSAELKTDVDSVNGTVSDDLTLNNKGALEIDDLSVGGKATINAGGNVTAGDVDDGTANVSAEELVIRTNSKSDIGEEDKPLIVDTDRITASGDDIYIESLGDLIIDEIRGDDVNVNAGGEVDAGKSNVNVRANDLTINAEGDIGDPDNKLIIYVPGNVDINSELGGVWYINLYEGGGTAFDNLVTDEAMNPKPCVRADLTSVRAEDGTVALRAADGSISLTLRDGEQLPKTNGKVLYIGALTDDLADIIGEVRILHLTRERVEDLRSMGYEWIVLRVGNASVLIHLTELEEGDYLITLAPGRTGSELKVNFNGADLEDIPGYITLADISETVS